ncbi:MAG: hypothetical protein ACE5K4_09215 [Candidatus Hydrothermarchaeota archaeon]
MRYLILILLIGVSGADTLLYTPGMLIEKQGDTVVIPATIYHDENYKLEEVSLYLKQSGFITPNKTSIKYKNVCPRLPKREKFFLEIPKRTGEGVYIVDVIMDYVYKGERYRKIKSIPVYVLERRVHLFSVTARDSITPGDFLILNLFVVNTNEKEESFALLVNFRNVSITKIYKIGGDQQINYGLALKIPENITLGYQKITVDMYSGITHEKYEKWVKVVPKNLQYTVVVNPETDSMSSDLLKDDYKVVSCDENVEGNLIVIGGEETNRYASGLGLGLKAYNLGERDIILIAGRDREETLMLTRYFLEIEKNI